MNIAVRYYTRSDNTKKLAEAVSKAVSAEAKDIEEISAFAVKIVSK